MSSEYFDFYRWLKSMFLREWVSIKERQPTALNIMTDWEDNKYFFANRKFNHVAAYVFTQMFDVDLPLNLDRWFLNTAFFDNDELSLKYVLDLEERLNVVLTRERCFIRG